MTNNGWVSEWVKEPVLKTGNCVMSVVRGFESHPIRQE